MDKAKRIEIWLTNSDQQNDGINEIVSRLCDEWRQKKYRIALFRSGSGDLFASAEGLLLSNLAG